MPNFEQYLYQRVGSRTKNINRIVDGGNIPHRYKEKLEKRMRGDIQEESEKLLLNYFY